MLTRIIENEGVIFAVYNNGLKLPFNEWSTTDDCIYYMPLATLVDNGNAEVTDRGCFVPFESLYFLDSDERMILGIPKLYDKVIRLRGDGILNDSSFKYRVEYLSHVPDGELYTIERKGNIIECGGTSYLLNHAQYQLIEEVVRYNLLESTAKTTDYNLIEFAKIKALAIEADCSLDSYLKNENVYVPSSIKIEVGVDNQGFTIEPSIEIEENEKFKSTFEKVRKVQSRYPLQRENGERVRVVLNPEQKANLEILKQKGGRHLTREQIKEIVDHPTELFDPEVIDLSELYSDRVINIGLYKPKFYPFISHYKSCWIAGARVETPENGTTKIEIPSKSELDKLNESIRQSEHSGNTIVRYNNTDIDIEDARFLAYTAEKQLKSPDKAIKTDDTSYKVLIIEENAEKLGFSVNDQIVPSKEKYTLFKNNYLNDNYSLKEHQEEGIAWLQYLYQSKANGCLMADDMGLGKTLQILYFIDWHSRKYPKHKPYLIVAPVSLLENWEMEYTRFFMAPRMNITKISSKTVSRFYKKDVVEWMQGLDIILTNYESLRIAQLNFCAVEFEVVILDEAQRIKTPGTMVTNAAKALKSNFKIAMTGTPVENTLLDLWCIMDFCVPGLLGNAKSFAAQYQSPLKSEDSDIIKLGKEVHDRLGIFFLRRLKDDVAKDLPAKYEIKEQVEMPPVQFCAYKNVVNDYITKSQPNILTTIMNMRSVSEHPYLLSSTINEHNSNDLICSSARLQATINFLDNIRDKQEKVIVFSERKEIQKMIQSICHERYSVIPSIINGDTPSISKGGYKEKQTRQACIDRFQSVDGFNIIIMSPIAAGMGLNITAANHVIHYSRHWNPAKENQATDRAYRIGQTKDVFVYYPMAVCKDYTSFDQTLDNLLLRKTELASSTIFPTIRVEVNNEELGHILFSSFQ